MASKYKYYNEDQDKKFNIASMRCYVDKKQELDKFLEKLITPLIQDQKLNILDACCGIGHISYFLEKISPQSNFFGVDQTPYLIDEAKSLCAGKENISFEVNDVCDLALKYAKHFDIAINWKTISWIPYYDELVRSLMAVTKKHIFLSSLFYEGDIDFEIKVREFKKEAGKNGFNYYYNVYSLPHFLEFLHKEGAQNVEVFDFEIGIDIPKPPVDGMGTYTVKLENDKRLQISGTLVCSWKIIRIDL